MHRSLRLMIPLVLAGLFLPDAVLPAAAGEAAPLPAKASEAIPFRVDHDAPLLLTERVDREVEGYVRLRVEFNGIRGDRVPAFLYVPRPTTPAATTRPAVLL